MLALYEVKNGHIRDAVLSVLMRFDNAVCGDKWVAVVAGIVEWDLMPVIFWVEQGDPIKGIGKDRLYGLCLGVP